MENTRIPSNGHGRCCELLNPVDLFSHRSFRLQKTIPSDSFRNIRFLIFSLGDRAYGPKFCAAGRKLTVRLLQLGAELLGEAGYGDDGTPNGGVFADLDLWIHSVLFKHTKPCVVPINRPPSLLSPFTMTRSNFERKAQLDNFHRSISPLSAYSYAIGSKREESMGLPSLPMDASVVSNDRLTSLDWEQDTRHVKLSFPSLSYYLKTTNDTRSIDELPYQAGDIVSILPVNSRSEVDRFLSLLPQQVSQEVDQQLSITYNEAAGEPTIGVAYQHWPSQCTFREWLTHSADIHSLPEREDLRALSYFCSPSHALGVVQAKKLRSLSETSESALYTEYVLREKRSWVDVLYDFDSLRAKGSLLSMEHLLCLLPHIRYRDFSIASSPTEMLIEGAVAVDLCVAIVKGTTPLGRGYTGLCSQFLKTIGKGDVIKAWIRPGSFQKLPFAKDQNCDRPVLCIGSGTGVAPLRSLLRERIHLLSSPEVEKDTREDNVLVFGCRKEAADFYYKKEWSTIPVVLHTAFSRDQWHKIYVQQVLKKLEAEETFVSKHILDRGGAVYVAGNPKMAKDVREILQQSIAAYMEGGEPQAIKFLNNLQRKGLFSVEAWG